MAAGDTEGVRRRRPVDRPLDRRRGQRLRPLRRHPHPGLRRRQAGERAHRPGRAGDRSQVATFGGDVAQTTYFSSSGGRTESGFLGAPEVPYLRSVNDPYDYYSPLHEWTFRFSQAEMLPPRGLRRRRPARHQGDQARRLAPDRLREADRHRRHGDDPRRHARGGAGPVRPLGVLHEGELRKVR